MSIKDTDTFLVCHDDTSYQVEAQNLTAIPDDALMLVNRNNKSYQVTGARVKSSLGGDNPTIKMTAKGPISDGDTVVNNGDNTVSKVSGTTTNKTSFLSPITHAPNGYTVGVRNSMVWNPDHKLWVVCISNSQTRSYVVTGTPQSDNSIVWGTPVQLDPSVVSSVTAGVYDATAKRFFFCYRSGSSSIELRIRSVVQAADGTLTPDASYSNIGSGSSTTIQGYPLLDYNPTIGKTIASYIQDVSNVRKLRMAYVTFDGVDKPSVTPRQDHTINEKAVDLGMTYTKDNKVAISYGVSNTTNDADGVYGLLVTADGTSFTFHSEFLAQPGTPGQYTYVYWVPDQDSVVYYNRIEVSYGSSTGSTFNMMASGGKIEGNTVNLRFTNSSIDFTDAQETHTVYNTVKKQFEETVLIKYSPTFSQGLWRSFVIDGDKAVVTEENYFRSSNQPAYPYNIAYGDGVSLSSFRYYTDPGNVNTHAVATYLGGLGNTNLTSNNFIGFSDGSYSDGQECKVHTQGAVNEAQSGLVTDEFYYCQADGSLKTTPDYVRVPAGTALSATSIKVQLN